jgi:hypothetical protein
MNKRHLSIVLGISLLAGVLSTLIFQQTKYFQMLQEPREITLGEYNYEKQRACSNCASLVTIKQVNNYEIGGLVFVSTFAILLIVSNLKNK